MNRIQNLSLTSALWLNFLFGTGALLIGQSIQHFVQVKPCALCLYQQIALAAVSVFSLISLLMRHNKYQKITAGLTLALVFLNFGIAAYHVGIEQHIIPTLAQCRVGGNSTGIDALRQSLLETDVVPCDKIRWTFLGLSMASYNMLLSAVVLLYWIIVLKLRRILKRHLPQEDANTTPQSVILDRDDKELEHNLKATPSQDSYVKIAILTSVLTSLCVSVLLTCVSRSMKQIDALKLNQSVGLTPSNISQPKKEKS